MYSAPKKFSFSSAPFGSFRRSVIQMTDGKFLEVRRNDITWTAAFRAANPDVKQNIYDSIHDWHLRLGANASHPHVDVWKMSRDWVAPTLAEEDEESYWLDFQLSTFMGAASATEEQLSVAIEEFSDVYPESPFLIFLLGENPYEVIESGDILTALEENGHILEEPAEWPSIRYWQQECLADLKLSDSADFTFSPEMTCFTEHLTGSWAGVLKAFRSYGLCYKRTFQKMLKMAKVEDSVELTGYIYTDSDIRTFFGLDDGGKGFLTFSDFRRQMLERGHLRPTTAPAAEKPSLLVVDMNVATGERTCIAYTDEFDDDSSVESDDSDDSDYVPSDSDSDDSDSDSDMEIDEEATPIKKDTETLKKEALKLVADTLAYADRKFAEIKAQKERPSPAVDPFAEIDAAFFRVNEIIMDEESDTFFKQILAQQFAAYCLRAEFKTLWQTHVFERIQMRSSLMLWRDGTAVGDDFLATATIKDFLQTYPA